MFRALLPQLHVTLNTFLARLVTEVRARFAGPIGYASLAFEGVDWTPFDVAATDAGYRDVTNAGALRAQVAQGKQFGVTEFGCGTCRGGFDLGGRGLPGYLRW
ncbi:hypothetical protein [Streptomyces canus]|uniref:hypothetical protein n=1 Tax=Streptomyces canus TaxID=58343 RepID=UPI002E2BAF6D|nr:hypothetical protein [Streptomyces canus]